MQLYNNIISSKGCGPSALAKLVHKIRIVYDT